MPAPLLMSGLPGNMAHEVATLSLSDPHFSLCEHALSTDRHQGEACGVGNQVLTLVGTSHRDSLDLPNGATVVDYTIPGRALENIRWYCERGLPFVMGTTGFDEKAARDLVMQSEISAVIAPNMAAPIVMLQAALGWVAKSFPGSCSTTSLSVRESHQQGKKDTSGTAKAILQSLQQLGIDANVDHIDKVREPDAQRAMGIPEEHLGGHAYHRYDMHSAGGTVHLALEHNVVGRRVYAEGTLRAVRFLRSQIKSGARGAVYNMEDVLGSTGEGCSCKDHE